MTAPILAHGTWASNGELIADMARLGHLTDDGTTWDGTYGYGTFWKVWRPANLCATDADPAKSPSAPAGLDAAATGWADDRFTHVVLDPDYKLNGTDQGEGERYGVAGPYKPAADRVDDGLAMMTEGARVLRPGGTLLYKTQNQVNAGAKVWQSDLATAHAATIGLAKIDELHFPSYRPQPQRSRCLGCRRPIMRRADGRWGTLGRSGGDPFTCAPHAEWHGTDTAHAPDPDHFGQTHSHVNYSTLLVFRKDTPR